MLEVRLFSHDRLIGHAMLLAIDPPMGVAGGTLIVTACYDEIRPLVDDLFHRRQTDWSGLALKAVTDSGRVIDAVGGIHIDDFIDGNPGWPPEIQILGIDCANGDYAAWFGDDPVYRHYRDET